MTDTVWRVARASVQGTKNKRRATACQDYSAFATMPRISDDAFVAAVADGMGTAPYASIGSKTAARAAVHQATASLWHRRRDIRPHHIESILNEAFIAARRTIEDRADLDGNPINDYATTLLLTIHVNDLIATAQVGDGAAIVADDDLQYTTLSKPQHGEYANQTFSITSRRALQTCSIDIVTPQIPITHLAMTTDGLLNLISRRADDQPHEPFFDNVFEWLRNHSGNPHWNQELTHMLASTPINTKTDDDTTLILAIR